MALVRLFWAQLTSMRTALILLLVLALVAIPGSLLPQRPVAPEPSVRISAFPVRTKLLRYFAAVDRLRASFFDTSSIVRPLGCVLNSSLIIASSFSRAIEPSYH